MAMGLGVFYVLMGVTVAIFPDWFLSVVDWPSREGLYVSAGIRVVVGIVLLIAAPASRFPTTLRVFGAIALVAGLFLLFLPIEVWGPYLQWWTVDHLTLFRTIFAIAAPLLGAFFAYAATPRRPAD